MRERRKVPRYAFGETGTLVPAGGGVGVNVIVREISTTGCAIEAAERLNVGKKCELYINWRGNQIGVQAQAVQKGAGARIGLVFRSVDKESQSRLSDLCAALHIRKQEEANAARSVRHSATVRQPAPATDIPEAMLAPLEPARTTMRRRVPRYISELPVRLSNSSTGQTSSVSLVSLSVLGGCLEGAGLPDVGEKCELSAEWQRRPLRIQGEIVWRNSKEQAGVNFASLDKAVEKLLRQICANLRLEPLGPPPL